ncbi:hypothetical protein L6R52_10730 [Myxococcota bacterium]|nr:hypothetical protein [Myxococcota bacterium]
MFNRLTLSASLAALFLAGCDVAGNERTNDQPLGSVEEGAPFDLSAAVRRVKLGYGWEGHAAIVRRGAYSVRAERGRVHFTPRAFAQAPDITDPAHDALSSDALAKLEAKDGAPLVLETVQIARGEAFDLGTGAQSIAEDGALVIDRGVAEERFRNDEVTTEQLWIFAEEPAGEGDLEVRVAVSGQSFAAWSEDGFHFVDEATGIGTVYGNAVWIDGSGLAVAVQGRFEDGHIVLTVPAEVLASSTFPATLDPVIGAEVIMTNGQVGVAAYIQKTPAVAANPATGTYFAVWSDIRAAGSYDIFGARVADATGVVLDDTNVPIATVAGDQNNPAVAFNGTQYLVVWSDRRDDGVVEAADIYGQLVNADGTLAGGEIAIAADIVGAVADRPSVAATAGGGFVVTWQDLRGGPSNVYFNRVTAAGAVLDGSGVPLYADANVRSRPFVDCAAANCLIAYQDGASPAENIRAARIDPADASVLDATPIALATRSVRDIWPVVAHDATNYMVAWKTDSDIAARRVAQATGAVVDAADIVVNNAVGHQSSPSIAFDGTNFLVVWQNPVDIWGARVSQAGTVLDPGGHMINNATGTQSVPVVAWGGTRYFVAWQDDRTTRGDIYGSRVTTVVGVVQPTTGIPVSRSAPRQYNAVIAFAGNYFLVVFADSRIAGDADYNIRAFRVSPIGRIVDPGGLYITSAAGSQAEPAVAWSGTQYLIVWKDNRSGNNDIYGARLTGGAGLTLVDAAGFVISGTAADQKQPAVTYDAGSGHFLVVWADDRNGGSANYDIYGCRVSAAAALVDGVNGFPVTLSAAVQDRPEVMTLSPSRWLVGWTDRRNFNTNADDLYFNVVDATGGVPTLFHAGDAVLSSAANLQGTVRFAPDGTGGAFAVWVDARAAVDNADIYGARIFAPGILIDGAGIALATEAQGESRPAIARNPAGEYLVVWRRQAAVGSEDVDLWGRRFTLAGAAIAPAFEISGPGTGAASGREDQPSVSFSAANRAIVAYQRYVSDAAQRAERVRYRYVTLP